jgi:GT2 family glycosyltransferase
VAPTSASSGVTVSCASIAIIVPGLNAAATLPRCLDALARSTVVPKEIVFFDDGSSDDSEAIAAARGVTVLRNDGPPIGPGMARTRAAKLTDCDLILFVDADVAIHPDALGRLTAALSADHVAAFGSYDDDPPASGVASVYANLRHHFVHQHGDSEASTFWTALGLVRRDAFLAVDGFSAAYAVPSIEDIELATRLKANGGRIRLVPTAQAVHLKRWTLLQLWRTDILRRAIPWSQLIASGRSSASGLNASVNETMAAILAWLLVVTLVAALAYPWLLAGTGLTATAYVLYNRRFFAFLSRRMSVPALAGSVILHWCYHLYASAILGVVLVAARFRQRVNGTRS